MDLITSLILIVVFIVIQQVAILYAINKIDKLARERDIYKDRLDVTPTSYELHTSEDYSTFVQTLQEQKKENEELKKKLVRLRNCAEKYGIQLGELEKENKALNSLINNYEEENPQRVLIKENK